MDRFFHLLPILLLGDLKSAQKAADTLSKGGLWQRAIELSNLWRVIPQFRKRLHELEITLPLEGLTKLQEASVIGTAQSLAALRLCADTIRVLEFAGIDSLAFKGIGLIGNLYTSPSERMVTDVDMLIDGGNLKRALGAIAGSSPSFNLSELLAYVQFLEKQSYHRLDNDFLYLAEKDGLKIDLQWRFGAKPPPAMEADRMLERAERINVLGASFRVASPADAITIAAHHSMRNNFSPASTLKDLCDTRAWWNVQGKRWKIDEVVNHSRECRLTVPLMALWKLLGQFDAGSPASEGLNEFQRIATAEEIRDSGRLQKSLNLQLGGSALNADLLRVLIDPTWVTGYVANKVRTIADGSINLRSHGETDVPPKSKRATMFFREVFRLNLKRLECYAAMKRSENRYSNYPQEPHPVTEQARPVARDAEESNLINGSLE
jgi:hypothetical protein